MKYENIIPLLTSCVYFPSNVHLIIETSLLGTPCISCPEPRLWPQCSQHQCQYHPGVPGATSYCQPSWNHSRETIIQIIIIISCEIVNSIHLKDEAHSSQCQLAICDMCSQSRWQTVSRSQRQIQSWWQTQTTAGNCHRIRSEQVSSKMFILDHHSPVCSIVPGSPLDKWVDTQGRKIISPLPPVCLFMKQADGIFAGTKQVLMHSASKKLKLLKGCENKQNLFMIFLPHPVRQPAMSQAHATNANAF